MNECSSAVTTSSTNEADKSTPQCEDSKTINNEAISYHVSNFSVSEIGQRNVTLSFESAVFHSCLLTFEVTVVHEEYVACISTLEFLNNLDNDDSTQSLLVPSKTVVVRTNDSTINLLDLKPFSKYSVRVLLTAVSKVVSNEKYFKYDFVENPPPKMENASLHILSASAQNESKEQIIKFQTLSDIPETRPRKRRPFPSFQTFKQAVRVYWEKPTYHDTCRWQNGQLNEYHLEVEGTSQWVRNSVPSEVDSNKTVFKIVKIPSSVLEAYIAGLVPFSSYRIRIFTRNRDVDTMNIDAYLEINVETEATFPHPPNYIRVEYKQEINVDFLIVRFRESYPPRGIPVKYGVRVKKIIHRLTSLIAEGRKGNENESIANQVSEIPNCNNSTKIVNTCIDDTISKEVLVAELQNDELCSNQVIGISTNFLIDSSSHYSLHCISVNISQLFDARTIENNVSLLVDLRTFVEGVPHPSPFSTPVSTGYVQSLTSGSASDNFAAHSSQSRSGAVVASILTTCLVISLLFIVLLATRQRVILVSKYRCGKKGACPSFETGNNATCNNILNYSLNDSQQTVGEYQMSSAGVDEGEDTTYDLHEDDKRPATRDDRLPESYSSNARLVFNSTPIFQRGGRCAATSPAKDHQAMSQSVKRRISLSAKNSWRRQKRRLSIISNQTVLSYFSSSPSVDGSAQQTGGVGCTSPKRFGGPKPHQSISSYFQSHVVDVVQNRRLPEPPDVITDTYGYLKPTFNITTHKQTPTPTVVVKDTVDSSNGLKSGIVGEGVIPIQSYESSPNAGGRRLLPLTSSLLEEVYDEIEYSRRENVKARDDQGVNNVDYEYADL